MEDNLLSDATGRNALYKIHVSLGKIVNSLNEGDKMSRRSRSVSVANSVATSAAGTQSVASGDRSMTGTDDGEDATVVLRRKDGDNTVLEDVAEEEEEEGEGDDDDDTVKLEPDSNENTIVKADGADELVEEFLSDEEDA